MSKFIRLTNANKDLAGELLLLNARYIVSVFSDLNEEKDPVTVIYGALQSSWHVRETVEQVWALLEGEVQ